MNNIYEENKPKKLNIWCGSTINVIFTSMKFNLY